MTSTTTSTTPSRAIPGAAHQSSPNDLVAAAPTQY